jgi:hypothetical protein
MSMWARDSDSFIQAPPPLFKYDGDPVRHPDNLAIADLVNSTTLLPDSDVKRLRKSYTQLATYLRKQGALKLFDSYTHARNAFDEARTRYYELRAIIQKQKHDTPQNLCEEYKQLKAQAKTLREKQTAASNAIQPYREHIKRKQDIERQLRAHKAAELDQKKEKELKDALADEAVYIRDQMQSALSRMGFSHEWRYSPNEQSQIDYVKFEKVVISPDRLQFKILVSEKLVFGGYVDMLPKGVYLSDLLTEKVMTDLSAVLEREVWSPHVGDDAVKPVNGAFIIVERLNFYERLPANINYDALMARYDMADHDSIPLVMGMREGKKVNWQYLKSPYGTHIQFTGITGSGKTVGIKGLATAIIETQSPRDVRFIFIDLKQSGDFRHFEDAPHTIKWRGKGVLRNVPEIAECLSAVKAEMIMRQQLTENMADNIAQYNRRVSENKKLPDIIVVFDEYADTRDPDYDNERRIIDAICIKIARQGRSPGIHLWLGLQTPRRQNMPQELRDNMTCKLDGHQTMMGASQSVSGNRAVMGLADVPGRMICTVGTKSFQVQMPFVDADDMSSAVKLALDSYGDIPAYELAAGETIMKPPSPEEIVIETAMQVFDGELKARPIWDYLKPEFSRREVSSIVDDITARDFIEYQGGLYTCEKQSGNWYLLVDHSDSHTESLIETHGNLGNWKTEGEMYATT